MDWEAFWVCNVDNTRCPVSAGLHGGVKLDRVAHFTDHDDVGVLTEHVFESALKLMVSSPTSRCSITDWLSLEHELNRILQRDDVSFEVGVDVLEHGRERGGLSGARGSGNQYDAAMRGRRCPEHRQQAEFSKLGTCVHVAHGQGERTLLLENVGSETADPGSR